MTRKRGRAAPTADDHELRHKWIQTAAQIITRTAAYIIIAHTVLSLLLH
jgi:hypothetical protein